MGDYGERLKRPQIPWGRYFGLIQPILALFWRLHHAAEAAMMGLYLLHHYFDKPLPAALHAGLDMTGVDSLSAWLGWK